MTEHQQRAMALATLIEGFGVKEITPTRIRIYEEAMESVLTPLLCLAVKKALARRTFLPRPAELLVDAEACRQEIFDANPFTSCEECRESSNWLTVIDESGIERLYRCPCRERWLQKLKALGVVARITSPNGVALVAGSRNGDPEWTS